MSDQAPARPAALLIGGYAGSGKTTLARLLAQRTGWPILDKDTTTQAVVEAALVALGRPAHDRDSDIYRTVIRPAEYEALIATVAENVGCGVSCIATAPFVAEFADLAWCQRIQQTLEAAGGTTRFVWISCDTASMRTNIRRRGADRDAHKLADWPTWASGLDVAFRPATAHTVVENSIGDPPLSDHADRLMHMATTTGQA